MKEATGELSTTVIAVVAIAAVAAIFTAFILPSIRSNLKARTYCSAAVQCDECKDGKRECHYYQEEGGAGGHLNISKDSIFCDCEKSTDHVGGTP